MCKAGSYLHFAKAHLSSKTIIRDYQTIFLCNSSCSIMFMNYCGIVSISWKSSRYCLRRATHACWPPSLWNCQSRDHGASLAGVINQLERQARTWSATHTVRPSSKRADALAAGRIDLVSSNAGTDLVLFQRTRQWSLTGQALCRDTRVANDH